MASSAVLSAAQPKSILKREGAPRRINNSLTFNENVLLISLGTTVPIVDEETEKEEIVDARKGTIRVRVPSAHSNVMNAFSSSTTAPLQKITTNTVSIDNEPRLHEGNLKVLKQTGMKSTWTKRYVILTATSFSYYSKADSDKPIKQILLSDNIYIKELQSITGVADAKFCFQITHGKNLSVIFKGDNQKDAIQWIASTCSAVDGIVNKEDGDRTSAPSTESSPVSTPISSPSISPSITPTPSSPIQSSSPTQTPLINNNNNNNNSNNNNRPGVASNTNISSPTSKPATVRENNKNPGVGPRTGSGINYGNLTKSSSPNSPVKTSITPTTSSPLAKKKDSNNNNSHKDEEETFYLDDEDLEELPPIEEKKQIVPSISPKVVPTTTSSSPSTSPSISPAQKTPSNSYSKVGTMSYKGPNVNKRQTPFFAQENKSSPPTSPSPSPSPSNSSPKPASPNTGVSPTMSKASGLSPSDNKRTSFTTKSPTLSRASHTNSPDQNVSNLRKLWDKDT